MLTWMRGRTASTLANIRAFERPVAVGKGLFRAPRPSCARPTFVLVTAIFSTTSRLETVAS
jgi:hypothetical protein